MSEARDGGGARGAHGKAGGGARGRRGQRTGDTLARAAADGQRAAPAAWLESEAFPPGQPIRPTPGLSAPGGAPRQWAFPVGYNIAQLPRATEQATFAQLRSLAALYDGAQLWIRALQIVTSTAAALTRAAPSKQAITAADEHYSTIGSHTVPFRADTDHKRIIALDTGRRIVLA